MKTYAILLVIILLSNQCYSQCRWEDFFTVKSGMSKFDAIKNLSLQNGVTEIKDQGLMSATVIEDNGEKEAYVTYLLKSQCIHGYKTSGQLIFKNDKLYRITLGINYYSSDLKSCIEDVEKILKGFNSTFPIMTKGEYRNEDNEKVNDSYELFRNDQQQRNFPYNSEFVTVYYEIDQNIYYSEIHGKWMKEPDIKGFFLRINYWDLRVK